MDMDQTGSEPREVLLPDGDERETARGPARASSPGVVDTAALEVMLDLPLDVTVELGRTRMQLGEALALQAGAIIELDRLPGEALDLYVNERLVARGEVVVTNDVLALRITELIGKEAPRHA